jgi:hypothetical protein
MACSTTTTGILAAMSSLALLEHTATAAPVLTTAAIAFYATVATVIPVLFIALAVQGTAYQSVLKSVDAADRRQTEIGLRSGPARAAAFTYLFVFIIAVLFLFILVVVAYAEVQAIYALYQGHASGSTALSVLNGVILLIIITAAPPVIAFLGTLAGIIRRSRQARNTSGAATQEAAARPGPEPGETATEQ